MLELKTGYMEWQIAELPTSIDVANGHNIWQVIVDDTLSMTLAAEGIEKMLYPQSLVCVDVSDLHWVVRESPGVKLFSGEVRGRITGISAMRLTQSDGWFGILVLPNQAGYGMSDLRSWALSINQHMDAEAKSVYSVIFDPDIIQPYEIVYLVPKVWDPCEQAASLKPSAGGQ